MIGTFCWNELMTTDAKETANFFCDLFGWSLKQSEMHPGYNMIVTADGKEIGGIMQMDQQHFGGMKSHTMPYVAVQNCDETCDRAKQRGGTVHVPPTDIPNVGRFAVISDKAGVTLSIIALKPPPSQQQLAAAATSQQAEQTLCGTLPN